MSITKLYTKLDDLGIKYQEFTHKAVMTCEDQTDIQIPAPHTKNLFLKDDKGKFWLVSALEDTKIDLKTLAKVLQVKSLRFGNDESLMQHLGVKSGAVSMFALINDEQNKVFPVIHEGILSHEMTSFHPLHNEATTVIASKDLLKFIKALGKDYKVLTS